MSVHQTGCNLDRPHDGDCIRIHGTGNSNHLGKVKGHAPGCAVGEHAAEQPCSPRITTTRMDVEIPALPSVPPERLRLGPQPTTPGPYHATVRGPGMDINVSGGGGMFGRVLEAIGDALSTVLDIDP